MLNQARKPTIRLPTWESVTHFGVLANLNQWQLLHGSGRLGMKALTDSFAVKRVMVRVFGASYEHPRQAVPIEAQPLGLVPRQHSRGGQVP
jgi:hypothetical protein